MLILVRICICNLEIPDALVGLCRSRRVKDSHASPYTGAMYETNTDFVLAFAVRLYLLREQLKAQVQWN